MKKLADILEEAEEKHFELLDLEEDAEKKGVEVTDNDRFFDLTFELGYLMRDYVDEKMNVEWEARLKTKTYFTVPGVKDFYSDKVGTVEIDPGIAEAVRVFNAKGYTTIASCSGHSRLSVDPGYIYFKVGPKKKLPKDLYWCGSSKKDGHVVIRWKPTTEKSLVKAQNSLLKYAESLKAVK